MKQIKTLGLALGLAVTFTSVTYSQEPNTTNSLQVKPQNEIRVKQKTKMEKFEPEMVISVEERTQMKEDRLAEIERGKRIIDTMNISERKKRKLLGDLYWSPYSDRLEKNISNTKIVDTKFEEDDYWQLVILNEIHITILKKTPDLFGSFFWNYFSVTASFPCVYEVVVQDHRQILQWRPQKSHGKLPRTTGVPERSA